MYRHGDTEVYGTLCYDEAVSASRPGILVVHSDPEEKRAHALAVEGYIALALEEGFYSEQLPGEGDESDLVKERVLQERFLAAFALLQDHKLTEKGKIAAIGYCWGGGAVLRMAKAGVDLLGVVSFHGLLPTASVKPGSIRAKILVCHAEVDSFVPEEHRQMFQTGLTEAGADWQLTIYGGTTHCFTNKFVVQRFAQKENPQFRYSESADRRSWGAMLQFFDEIFSD